MIWTTRTCRATAMLAILILTSVARGDDWP
jgi:hypothetical protein